MPRTLINPIVMCLFFQLLHATATKTMGWWSRQPETPYGMVGLHVANFTPLDAREPGTPYRILARVAAWLWRLWITVPDAHQLWICHEKRFPRLLILWLELSTLTTVDMPNFYSSSTIYIPQKRVLFCCSINENKIKAVVWQWKKEIEGTFWLFLVIQIKYVFLLFNLLAIWTDNYERTLINYEVH